jgi:formylmethanofuran dehydrogenase subunit A
MPLLKIANGTVYDPANGVDGVVKDIWIRDGKVVEPPVANAPGSPEVRPDRVLDATGLVVMPGGVDMHAHIAGPKVNVARKMRPEDKRKAPPVRRTPFTRSGTGGSVPSTFATGYLYAGLGYTTAFDAAIPPLGARHAHEEFHDTPVIDKGFLVLMGNNHYVLNQVKSGDTAKLRAYVAWLLGAAKGYGVKLVNPGGVEVWKEGGGNVTGLDSPVEMFDVTPRQIITALAQTAMDLGLPHQRPGIREASSTPAGWRRSSRHWRIRPPRTARRLGWRR